MIEDYSRSERSFWLLLGRELLAWTAAGLLFPMGIGSSGKRTPRQTNQRTVVLIHGYLSNRSALFLLESYLRSQGVRTLNFDYASVRGIEQGAIRLKAFLRRHVRGGRVDLVCHSMGGLVARTYLQQLGGARRVDRCITLGTPHRGTYNAYWIRSRVGRELKPDSAILRRLESTRSHASKVRFTSIVAGADNIVIPRVFAANEETVFLPDIGHMGLLFSPAAFRAVGDRLGHVFVGSHR
jgi:triacylglycerol lipase